MRQTSQSARHASVSDPTVVGEQTCTFLRGLYPRATAENVAADLNAYRVKTATIAKMLERRSTPSTHLWIALSCVYGPEFLCAVLSKPPVWMSAAAREQHMERIDARIAALQSERGSL